MEIAKVGSFIDFFWTNSDDPTLNRWTNGEVLKRKKNGEYLVLFNEKNRPRYKRLVKLEDPLLRPFWRNSEDAQEKCMGDDLAVDAGGNDSKQLSEEHTHTTEKGYKCSFCGGSHNIQLCFKYFSKGLLHPIEFPKGVVFS